MDGLPPFLRRNYAPETDLSVAGSKVGYGYDYTSLNHNSSGLTRRNIKLLTMICTTKLLKEIRPKGRFLLIVWYN